MERECLLDRVTMNFGLLRRYTSSRRQENGLGAVVFFREDAEISRQKIDCEYWSVGRLRDCLRQLDEYDEVVYRWAREAVESDSLPVVVFGPGERPNTISLAFHTLTSNQN